MVFCSCPFYLTVNPPRRLPFPNQPYSAFAHAPLPEHHASASVVNGRVGCFTQTQYCVPPPPPPRPAPSSAGYTRLSMYLKRARIGLGTTPSAHRRPRRRKLNAERTRTVTVKIYYNLSAGGGRAQACHTLNIRYTVVLLLCTRSGCCGDRYADKTEF